MSELKAVHAFDVYEAYTKTGDDDAAQVYLKSEVDATIAELKAENQRLKKKMDDYHLMSDIRRAKIKELKRALWMARKAHAVAMFAYWDSHYRDNHNAVYRNRNIYWLRNRWLLILDAIIKKEKEYK
jgi:hypothetical protein